MASLSVIVPLYNNEQYIRECVMSIQRQSYSDIRIIIVDDGSTDGGYELCQELARTDSRIEAIHQKNKGLIEARYTGLQHCKTEYATFVDADDFILYEAYSYAIDAMQRKVDLILYDISRYYNENVVKREKSSLLPGYYNQERIKGEVFPHLFWGLDKQEGAVECSQCVRIVKTKLLLKEHERILNYKFYFGEDAAVTYPLFLHIEDMEVIDHCYYMHRQRKEKCPPYIADDNYFFKVLELYSYLKNVFSSQDEKYHFAQQLDYYYIYMINNKKRKYNDFSKVKYDFLFPFRLLPQNKRILLYGAGSMGNDFYNQIMEYDFCKKVIWVDKNANNLEDNRINPISYINQVEFDYVLIANSRMDVCQEIRAYLIEIGIPENIIYDTFHNK